MTFSFPSRDGFGLMLHLSHHDVSDGPVERALIEETDRPAKLFIIRGYRPKVVGATPARLLTMA
jgi:hypothetical protein